MKQFEYSLSNEGKFLVSGKRSIQQFFSSLNLQEFGFVMFRSYPGHLKSMFIILYRVQNFDGLLLVETDKH